MKRHRKTCYIKVGNSPSRENETEDSTKLGRKTKVDILGEKTRYSPSKTDVGVRVEV